MLQKIILIWASVFASLYADMHYALRSSLIGGVADVEVHHRVKSGEYTSRVEIKAKGLAKALSGDRRETHISKGKIKHGEYYAREYTVIKKHKEMKYLKRYFFDYLHGQIIKITKKWKKGQKLYSKKETLHYFAHNDMLTIYHNILHFKKKHKTGKYTIALAGAEHDGGKVTFGLASGKTPKESDILTLVIKKSSFSHGKGRLRLDIDQSGSVSKGKLAGVKILGTVTLKRVD